MKDRLILSLVAIAVAHVMVQPVLANKVNTPTIREPQRAETHYFELDQKVVLKCRADGEPLYKWMIGTEVVKQKYPQFPISFDSRTGDLTIEKYNTVYDADYHCVASISEGKLRASSMSQVQTLKQTKIPEFKNKDSQIDRFAKAYTAIKLDCGNQGDVVVKPGVLQYYWYTSENSEQIPMDGGRKFIDQNGNLYFTYLLESDATSENLKYLCGYSASQARAIYMGSATTLKVEPGPASGTAAQLMYNTGKVEAEIGSEAKFECVFSGYDTRSADHLPTVSWSDGRNAIVANEKYQLDKGNRVLTIKDLQEDDEGLFSCMGRTTSGNTVEIHNRLNVTSKPRWTSKGPETQTKAEFSNAVFHCDAKSLDKEAAPDPPKWFINGEPLSTMHSFKKYLLSNNNKTMTITDLEKPTDIQCIQCTVTNSVGQLMGDACLNVVTPIKITDFPDREQKIKRGDIIQLTLAATSDDDTNNPLKYEWIFNNQTYTKTNLPDYITHDVQTDAVFINTSRLPEKLYTTLGGTYTLRVFNLYDHQSKLTTVELLDIAPPPAPVAASAGFDMWIIGLIVGILFLMVVIAIIIFVICRKQQEGDYNVDKKETGAGLDPEKELRDKGFNDLSRPDYDDYDFPEKKPRGDLEYDDVPIGGDDESLGEYGDEEDTHFNEDGSFIGIYQKKENERQGHKTESTI